VTARSARRSRTRRKKVSEQVSRYEEFEKAHREIRVLEEYMALPNSTGDDPYRNYIAPLAKARIEALKGLFDEPTPAPVEPVKVKAKRGDVDGAVRNALGSEITDYPARDWTAWAKEMGLNRKSVLAAVRRHEKNKT